MTNEKDTYLDRNPIEYGGIYPDYLGDTNQAAQRGGKSYDALMAAYNEKTAGMATRDTAFSSISETFKATQDLCNRVSVLAERLAGSTPSDQSQAVPVAPDNGLLASVRTSAILTRSAVMDAIAEISRLERELP